MITHYNTQTIIKFHITTQSNITHTHTHINIRTNKYSITEQTLLTISIKCCSKLFSSKYTDSLINAQYKLKGWTYVCYVSMFMQYNTYFILCDRMYTEDPLFVRL